MGQTQVFPLSKARSHDCDIPSVTAKSCWMETNKDCDYLRKLRRATNISHEGEIKVALIKYAKTIELIISRYPNMGKERADWALAMALSPEWYGDVLTDRLHNSMLVSALLLTVTAAYFTHPPLTNVDSYAYTTFIYVTGICTMCFMLSIVFGIFFIENAKSRAYTQNERFVLIIQFYIYKDLCQILMAFGSILFPIVLVIPGWQAYLPLDAVILFFVVIFYAALSAYIMLSTTLAAKAEQTRRLNLFLTLTDPKDCRLLPYYYPPDADMQLEDLKIMYK